ncbi:MAG: class I SAM-dependent methyltransferase [Erysipelotrichaceae bacterium]|nr:class I SAM-dependent methyltransferase [Erysipelotrichaceae bacterium]
MEQLSYWNHNSAYYDWIKKKAASCKSILDIGCGDGSLLMYLDDGQKELVGLDIDSFCIRKACERNRSGHAEFILTSFDDYDPRRSFDAVIFVASIHHMDMRAAIEKAKALLSPNGLLLIVGLASPSTFTDYIIEGLRVIPCKILSCVKGMHSSEDEQIPVSYNYPPLNEIRSILADELPHHNLRYGLYYRYLLEWAKQ